MLIPAKSQEAPAFASNDNSQGRAETMPLKFTLIGKTSGPVEWCAARPKGIDQPGKQRDAAHQTACHSLHDVGIAAIIPEKLRHLERVISCHRKAQNYPTNHGGNGKRDQNPERDGD
ncbi:hypothetical protein [Sphingomonas sp.]|uniref:hypothetical protein n=1 Tax=Sphingomonas sp. TaxID=28214 RepID=UPI0035A82A9C